jgi:Family of unknown function (DUF5338)
MQRDTDGEDERGKMPKSYTDDLAAWVKDRAEKKRRRDEAAVAFLAVKEKVADALAAGYALTTIWEHMSATGMVKFSYETFRAHARRYIKAKAAPEPTPTPSAPKEASPATAPQPTRTQQSGNAAKPASGAQATPTTTKPAGIPGFTFNPNPDKKDLL